ncbi:hypothetical protein E0M35_11435 [Bacillus thuringiensis]|uniref:Uncharacterized protein n=1 Tax=Bacillus thuringiensis TaxID=1428 RepID=A0A9W3VD62_BACTU|nr:hypothetical protein D7J84_20345 [Bacillus thuringiensis]OXB96091.1 hypothetical protein CGQ22_26300 [Bacillus sp. M13(2017)]PNK40736.1 hypothetical protein CBR55_03385 [Bacillus thuringiensis]QCY62750.1 hypothetical protein FHE73_19180 [Bacillus thuringiensis]TBX44816.1 hypothetical protein E0M35_11435 [Bacillus thuringiensis]
MKIASSLLMKCKIIKDLFIVKIGEIHHTMVMFIGIKQYALGRTTRNDKKGMSICVGKTSFL